MVTPLRRNLPWSMWPCLVGCVAGYQAHVKNQCNSPIYLQSVQPPDIPAPAVKINPGEIYSEDYKPVVHAAGVSIKNSKAEAGGTVADPITQFEYSFVPDQLPDLYYDISNINNAQPRQFCEFGLALYPSSPQCPAIVCPPDCTEFCPQVYNMPSSHATNGCPAGDLTLIFCIDG